MTDFAQKLHHLCRANPMRLDYYMQFCLNNAEQSGYYQNHDMFGASGDFTTAPEISQLFGDIIAAWVIWQWQEKGKQKAILAEAGPGRGSLMLDIVTHAQKICPEFLSHAEIHLIETSPYLKKIQEKRLADVNPIWHQHIDKLPQGFLILLGNEFLDALPARQFYCGEQGWGETHIGYNHEKSCLEFCHIKSTPPLPILFDEQQNREKWLEFSQQALDFCDRASQHIKQYDGFALFIDYGESQPIRTHPSFQAVSKHQFQHPLKNLGKCDLTMHVNFSLLDYLFQTQNLPIQFSTQKQFLELFGIKERAEQLMKSNPKRKKTIEAMLARLIGTEEMGELFKFMAVNAC